MADSTAASDFSRVALADQKPSDGVADRGLGQVATGGAPLVSVVVCTYNAGAFLAQAIESVVRQTYTNLEIIVVDDGSSDHSVEAAKKVCTDPRIIWLHQANQGKPAAMNRAISVAKGKYYASQDADDLSHPRRLELLVETMEARPEVAGIFSGHQLILDGREVAPITRPKEVTECRSDIDRMAMPGQDPTCMYRISSVREFTYDVNLPVVEIDYILRVGEKYPMLVHGDCLYSYRIHVGSITHSDPTRRERLVLEVIRRACERRGRSFQGWLDAQPKKRNSRSDHADNGVAAHFIVSVQDQRRLGRFVGAVRCGIHCALLQPLDPHYYKALVYALTPLSLHRYLKARN